MWKSVVLSMASLFLAVSRAQEPSAQFRVEVDHVMVYAAVADKQGRFRTDLGRQDFSVYEDGVLQEVTHFSLEHVPLSVVCLLDTSGSMEGEKLMHAKDALVHFAERLTPQDEIALIAFDDELQQISPFTHDWKGFKRELRSVMAEGGTSLRRGRGSHGDPGTDPRPPAGRVDPQRRRGYGKQNEVRKGAAGGPAKRDPVLRHRDPGKAAGILGPVAERLAGGFRREGRPIPSGPDRGLRGRSLPGGGF
ncbi:MAG: VWA domain-containing protein [Acidobacteria bacterium]|nr:VWA domain-containing protein [Acidobacteriota bacterium]